ncbi:MAG: hypothetical protein MZW92_53830 [Comamonadaceae bacterium]|nr:hypothetical protein [Comamonadaceae bacterium]
MLVVGVAVPTPGAVGGFHKALPDRRHGVLSASANDRAVGAAHRAARDVVRAGDDRRRWSSWLRKG